MSNTKSTESSNEVLRLPLWKNALDEMRESGVQYGGVYTAEFFEDHLKCKRDEISFGIWVSEIRRELEKDGFYLSGRGHKGSQYVILAPAANSDVMAGYQRRALDAMKRGVILGTNTRLDTLTSEERAKHERLLQNMATRIALVSRKQAESPSEKLKDASS